MPPWRRYAVLANLLAAGQAQSVILQVEVLVVGGNASVADQHGASTVRKLVQAR